MKITAITKPFVVAAVQEKIFAGASGVHHHMTNTRITDPEILENRYPLRLDGIFHS